MAAPSLKGQVGEMLARAQRALTAVREVAEARGRRWPRRSGARVEVVAPLDSKGRVQITVGDGQYWTTRQGCDVADVLDAVTRQATRYARVAYGLATDAERSEDLKYWEADDARNAGLSPEEREARLRCQLERRLKLHLAAEGEGKLLR
ncbi:MAG: hypothetical protein HYZ53_20940 [Planctomycetes bacterium]|nr:hypothetical protein [Planctomycetota bacterium]